MPIWRPRATSCSAPNRRMTWRICLTRGFWTSPSSEPGLVPQQEVDEAHSRDLVAEAQVSAAKSHITACEQRIRVSQAEQARFKTLYQYAVITAPFAGVVTKRYANSGSLIQAGTASQTQAMPVVRLSENGLLRLALPVPESAVPLIHLGEPVDVQGVRAESNLSGASRPLLGQSRPVHSNHEDGSRCSQSHARVGSGMYAEVDLITEQRKNVLSVPVEAVDGSGRLRPRLHGATVRNDSRSFRSASASRPRSESRSAPAI